MNLRRLLGRGLMRDEAIALLRIWLGVTMIVHGEGKVFGGMAGFSESVADMGLPLPDLFAWAAALSEFAGGILLILGLLARPAAFFVMTTMFVAAFVRHFDDSFYSKEKPITFGLIALVILVAGPGKASIDRLIMRSSSST